MEGRQGREQQLISIKMGKEAGEGKENDRQQQEQQQQHNYHHHQQQQQQQAQEHKQEEPQPQQQSQAQEAGQGQSAEHEQENKIPEQLKHKHNIQRPPLGHVVPKIGGRRPVHPQGKPLEQQTSRPRGGKQSSSTLKILGGSARGRRIESPLVYLRPMMGKVREAVFSTLTYFQLYEQDVCRHLDIFAGSGSVGLESLSRGAKCCTFVDLSPDCCQVVENNLRLCQFHNSNNAVICADALSVLKQPESVLPPLHPNYGGGPLDTTYQIVTVCPPYEEVVYADLLDAIANSKLVMEDTIVLVEYPIELGPLPHVYTRNDGGKMIGIRNRRYGRTVIAMYIINPTGKLPNAESRPEEFVSLF